MELRFTDWMNSLLGVQSVAQFGAQPQNVIEDVVDADCAAFFSTSSTTLGSSPVVSVKNNLAVVPEDWTAGGVSECSTYVFSLFR